MMGNFLINNSTFIHSPPDEVFFSAGYVIYFPLSGKTGLLFFGEYGNQRSLFPLGCNVIHRSLDSRVSDINCKLMCVFEDVGD